MSFFDRLRMFDVRSFLSAPTRKSLQMVIGPDGESFTPVTADMLAGSGGATPAPPPTTSAPYAPRSVTVTDTADFLPVPPDAPATVQATVHVVSGSVRRSIGGQPGPDTPILNVEDSEQIAGGELSVYKLVREGGTDAVVYVEYRVVG